MVGNKIDLVEKETVDEEEVVRFAKEKGIKYKRVSALSGVNINEMFKNDKIFDQEMSGFVNSQNFDMKKYAFVAVCSYLTDKDCKIETNSNGETFLIFEDTEQENKIFLGKQDVENTICKSLYL